MTIERHADKESFAGACDDLRIGVTLIFYLQNPAEYMTESSKGTFGGQPLTLIRTCQKGNNSPACSER